MTSLNEKLENIIKETNDEVSLLFAKLNDGVIYQYQSDVQVVSASTIKTPIMLCALEEVKKGNIKLTDKILVEKSIILEDTEVFESGTSDYTLYELLMWMIISSDNTATNVLIQYFGMDKINQYSRDVLGLKSTSLQRMMLDFKAIENGYNNYTSMDDMYILFTKLFNKEILTNELCDVAMNILYNQRCQNQIMRYIYEPTKFAHKTGGLDYRNLDVGVMNIQGEYYYIGISIISSNIKGNYSLMGKLGKTIYDEIKKGRE